MQTLGVPYPEGFDQIANEDLAKQAEMIAADLKSQGIQADPKKEIIALIAYLQKLGRDVHTAETNAPAIK